MGGVCFRQTGSEHGSDSLSSVPQIVAQRGELLPAVRDGRARREDAGWPRAGRGGSADAGQAVARPALVVLAIVLAVVFVAVRWSGLRSTTRTFTSSLSSSGMHSATFMGITTRAQRVAYVCTAGGTSRNTIDMFLGEMRQSVGRLEEWQAFNVCLTAASDGMLDQSYLLPANLSNKRRAFEHERGASVSLACRGR